MSLTRIQPSHSVWHYVWKLLRLRRQIFFSGLRHARPGRQIGYLLLMLVFLALLVGGFAASWAILSYLRSPTLAEFIDPAPFLSSVPVLVVTVAFVGILLFSFGVLLQALYLAGDMDFLLSAPVPMRAVFVTKLLQAILPNLALTFLFGLPVLYGLGAAGQYHVVYYPLAVIVLGAWVLAAAGLASLLVMGVVRLFPARSVVEVLGLLGGLISLLCSQSGLFSGSDGFSQGQAAQVVGALARLNTPWSPLAWAGRALLDMGEGRWLSGLGFLLLTLGVAGAIFVVTLSTAERLYFTGWARLQTGTRKKKTTRVARPRNERTSPLAALSQRIVPAAVRGLIVKDALVLRRDLRNMSQLIGPLILGVVYAVMLLRSSGEAPAGRGEAPAWFMQTLENVLVYANVGIALFVGWTLMSRLAMTGFSQEGKQYWLLKTAPVSAGKLLAAKFVVAYVPTLALGWAFLVAITLMQRASPAVLLFGLPVVALCIAGGAGIDLAFGVVAVNLEWDDPRQMMRGSAGCLSMLVSAGYMIVALALFFGPPIGFALLAWSETVGQLIGVALGGVVSLLCAVLPIRLVRGRVAHIGEV